MQFPVCPELTRKNGLATLHRNQTHPNVLNDRGRLFKPTEPLLLLFLLSKNRRQFLPLLRQPSAKSLYWKENFSN